MVTKIKHIAGFFKLIRLPNLIMVAATFYLMRYCIVFPMLNNFGFEPRMGNFDFFLLAFSIISLTAGGYVINDYFDQKTDLINRPGTVIVGRHINRRWAMAFHIIFNSLAILIGIYLSLKLNILYLSLLFIVGSGILWFYSTTYKKQLIIGNLIVSFSTAMVPMMVLLFELPLLSREYGNLLDGMGFNVYHMAGWIIGFALFAFIISLIREIVKDTEDFEGDRAYGMQTLPIVAGIKWTKLVIFTLMTVFAGGLIYIYVSHLTYPVCLIYIVVFQLIPLTLTMFLLYRANSKKAYHHISLILKFMMATGIFFAFVARHLIVHQYLIF
ncbi:MAG: geranylgeranylglycerol-phosphate geranylgeranyltransferase [Bacteroidales bacterium]